MAKYFVFAEFGSTEVKEFLDSLRNALSAGRKQSPIHVTLRGPYPEPPPEKNLQEFAELLHGHGVKIHDHGYFYSPAGFSVFLRAECTPFRELWDKPDFKVSKARIQPHITIYESHSRGAAQAVRDFLKQERIHIHTYDLYLSVYASKPVQRELFDLPTARPSGQRLKRDIWRVNEDVLDRAKVLGRSLAMLGDA